MRPRVLLSAAIYLTLAALGCEKAAPPTPSGRQAPRGLSPATDVPAAQDSPPTERAVAPPTEGTPANDPAPAPGGGGPAPTPTAGTPPSPSSSPELTQLSGTLVERIDAGAYSYLRLTTSSGERWAAVPKTTLAKGVKVTIVKAMLMEGFSSKTLNRTWAEIYFGELGDAAGKPPGHPETAAAPAPAPATPSAPAPGAPAPPASLAGKVLERIDASSYSYLRLATESGEVWAAVPQSTVAVGTWVTVVNPAAMTGFESKTLGRKWDVVYFGTLAGASAPPPPPPAPAPPAKKLTPEEEKASFSKVMGQHQGMAAGPADAANVKVDKAPGPEARTVAEVWAQRAALKDRKVVVRGKVVKLMTGVMGKTWLHLRDGSGTAAGKDNDLTVTTTAAAAMGDLVTATGIAHIDRDFGAGYSYPVILEDAAIAK